MGVFMKNIIVVDMQKGFMNERNSFLIEKINRYLKENEFDNIFFTKCVNDSQSPFTSILKWNGARSEDEQEIVVDVLDDAKVLVKNGYGLSNASIELVKSLGVREIEICGTDTDACCLAIAFNMFDGGIKPIILSNLCASSSSNENMHKNTIEIMKRQFGSVVD